MRTVGDEVYTMTRDLIAVIYSQLPDGIKDKVRISVDTDAHYIRPRATFKDEQNREWTTALVDMQFEGLPLRCKVPEEFLAQLCVVV